MKMKLYPNFYENAAEAQIRLKQTVIMYDGLPYYCLCLGSHPDGIIRLYLDPIGHPQGGLIYRTKGIPLDYPPSETCEAMDGWIKANPELTKEVVVAKMDSPLFNRFRPFPLGMANFSGKVYYLERTPRRPNTQQGCTARMVMQTKLTSEGNAGMTHIGHEILQSAMFKDCVLGQYLPPAEALKGLLDPDVLNQGVAFTRDFAFLRGPVKTIFLAYKTDIIGKVDPEKPRVTLLAEFLHTKECIEELSFFKDIRIQ